MPSARRARAITVKLVSRATTVGARRGSRSGIRRTLQLRSQAASSTDRAPPGSLDGLAAEPVYSSFRSGSCSVSPISNYVRFLQRRREIRRIERQTLITQPKTSTRTGGYSKADRILKRRDFEGLQTGGEKLYTKFFLLSVRESATGRSRLGITVTKRVSPKAVERNRVKRRIREFFRSHRGSFRAPLDLVVIARRDAMHCSLAEITRTFLGALGKHGFLSHR